MIIAAEKTQPDLIVESDVETYAIEGCTRTSISELVPEAVTIPAVAVEDIQNSSQSSILDNQAKASVKIKREIKREGKSEPVESDRLLMPPPSQKIGMNDFELEAPSPEHEGSDNLIKEDGVEGGELDLTDIDDREIEGYIMNAHEAERKRVLWEKLNNEYLVSQERKSPEFSDVFKFQTDRNF